MLGGNYSVSDVTDSSSVVIRPMVDALLYYSITVSQYHDITHTIACDTARTHDYTAVLHTYTNNPNHTTGADVALDSDNIILG